MSSLGSVTNKLGEVEIIGFCLLRVRSSWVDGHKNTYLLTENHAVGIWERELTRRDTWDQRCTCEPTSLPSDWTS